MKRKQLKKSIQLLLLVLGIGTLAGCGTGNRAEQTGSEQMVTEGISSQKSSMETIVPEKTAFVPEPVEQSEFLERQEQAEEERLAFYMQEIYEDSDIFLRINGKSYKGGLVPLEDLRYVHILYVDGDGNTKEGEIICNAYIADDILDIFKELYEQKYPIEKVCLVDDYDGDDEKSMEDNNTSAYNDRSMAQSSSLSKHALGLAIDLNPLYNPYVKVKGGKTIVAPQGAEIYTNREEDYPYKITKEDLAYQLFTEKGFIWGGSWSNTKDYQHFEIDTATCKKLYPDCGIK